MIANVMAVREFQQNHLRAQFFEKGPYYIDKSKSSMDKLLSKDNMMIIKAQRAAEMKELYERERKEFI